MTGPGKGVHSFTLGTGSQLNHHTVTTDDKIVALGFQDRIDTVRLGRTIGLSGTLAGSLPRIVARKVPPAEDEIRRTAERFGLVIDTEHEVSAATPNIWVVAVREAGARKARPSLTAHGAGVLAFLGFIVEELPLRADQLGLDAVATAVVAPTAVSGVWKYSVLATRARECLTGHLLSRSATSSAPVEEM